MQDICTAFFNTLYKHKAVVFFQTQSYKNKRPFKIEFEEKMLLWFSKFGQGISKIQHVENKNLSVNYFR